MKKSAQNSSRSTVGYNLICNEDSAEERPEVTKEETVVAVTADMSTSSTISSKEIINQFSKLVFAKDNRFRIGLATILTGASTGMNLLSPYLLGQTVSLLSTQEETITIAGINLSRQELLATVVAAYAFSQVLPNLSSQIMARVTANNIKKLLLRSTDHLLQKSLKYHVQTPASEQFYLIQKGFDLSYVGTSLATQVTPILIQIFIASSLLWLQYGIVIGASLLALLGAYVSYCALTAKYLININEAMLKASNEVYISLIGTLEQYKVMRDFGKYEYALSELDKELTKWAMVCTRNATIPLQVSLGYSLIPYGHMAGMIMYVGAGVKSGKYNTSDFVAIISYLLQLASLLPAFGRSLTNVFESYPNLKFVFGELAKPSEVVDLYPHMPLTFVPGVAAAIEFDQITFSYPRKAGDLNTPPLFDKLSFRVNPGERVALVSESGAGKTTLFNLLYGYYQPSSGSIKINGQDISKLSLAALQENIGIFGQNPNLFKGSIRKNICYGAKNPELVTDDAIWELARATNLYDFLNEFTDKLNTDVGEGGKALSGGQQQKVAILRGLMKEAPIWLLDEVTAALDAEAATQVLSAINKASTRVTRTSLMITHKLSEARDADRIVVLDKGQVIAQGTNTDLLQGCALYQKLWRAGNNQDAQLVQQQVRDMGVVVPEFMPSRGRQKEVVAEFGSTGLLTHVKNVRSRAYSLQ